MVYLPRAPLAEGVDASSRALFEIECGGRAGMYLFEISLLPGQERRCVMHDDEDLARRGTMADAAPVVPQGPSVQIEEPGLRAIFVDGVGHVREMTLHKERSRVDLVVPQPRASAHQLWTFMDSTSEAAFERLGRLRDGRIVYGLEGTRLRLWAFEYRVTEALALDDRACRDFLERDVRGWLETCGQPALTLAETKSFDEDERIWQYLFEGVAVERTTHRPHPPAR